MGVRFATPMNRKEKDVPKPSSPVNYSNETVTRPNTRQPHPMGTVTKNENKCVCLTPIIISQSLSLLKLIRKFPGQFIDH